MSGQTRRRLLQASTLGTLLVAAAALLPTSNQNAISAPNGEDVYKTNCATCHAGGGNMINPKKPVKGSAKLASKEAFKAYLLKPTGSMMAYPKIANDAPTLDALYAYCKTLK